MLKILTKIAFTVMLLALIWSPTNPLQSPKAVRAEEECTQSTQTLNLIDEDTAQPISNFADADVVTSPISVTVTTCKGTDSIPASEQPSLVQFLYPYWCDPGRAMTNIAYTGVGAGNGVANFMYMSGGRWRAGRTSPSWVGCAWFACRITAHYPARTGYEYILGAINWTGDGYNGGGGCY